MATRNDLVRAHEDLHVEIRAAEDWQDGYKQSPATFDELLRLEARLEAAVTSYIHELAGRAPSYVDWSRLPAPINADAGPVANNDDPVWKKEEQLLTVAVLQLITELVAVGALAGEDIYAFPLAYDSLDDAIMQAARLHTANLVKGATATTRKLIREAVAQSIALGEDVRAATGRLMKVIDNPIRAQLIAQTEPVNAYQKGLRLYADSTGAKEKTWDGLVGACNICSPLIGETIPIEQQFTLANGKEVDHPAGHPRCRCSVIYIY